MQLIIIVGFNLVLMLSFFLIGVYLFMQVDEKVKRHSLLLDSQVDLRSWTRCCKRNDMKTRCSV